MEYLAQYYKNLSEQLQQQINLLEAQLNEIMAYSDEERSNPDRKAKEFRDTARLLKIAKAQNVGSRSGLPDKSDEFGERLTQMLRAKGIDASVEKLPTVSGSIRSSRIYAPYPITSAADVEEKEPGKFTALPTMRIPIDQLKQIDVDAVPEIDIGGNDRDMAAFRANQLRRERRQRINAEIERIAGKNAFVDKKKSWTMNIDDAPTTSHSSNATY